MIDTDKYIEDVEEKYNLIMNLMDDEEREFEIKTRIRQSNKMKVAIDTLDTEVKRLRDGIRSILSDYDITELIRDVPQDEWNFEQQALIRKKEMIE